MERFRIRYVKKNLAYVFHDSLIAINEQKIFDLWEYDFDIKKKMLIFVII